MAAPDYISTHKKNLEIKVYNWVKLFSLVNNSSEFPAKNETQ